MFAVISSPVSRTANTHLTFWMALAIGVWIHALRGTTKHVLRNHPWDVLPQSHRRCCHIQTPVILETAILIHHWEQDANQYALCNWPLYFFLWFLTHRISKEDSGVYIHTGLSDVSEHGITDISIDTFHQNKDVLNEQHVDHAMAMVVLRRDIMSPQYRK